MSLRAAELVEELRALEAQLRSLRIRAEAAAAAETSASEGTSRPSASNPPELWSAEWVAQLRAAVTPEALAALDLSPLKTLRGADRLSVVPPNWPGADRLARAFRFGVLAKESLDSGDFTVTAPPTTFYSSVHYHIVLYCPDKPAGFWSSRSRPFLNLVGDPTGRGLGPDPPHSVFGSFPSKLEVSAFLLGARRAEWPAEL